MSYRFIGFVFKNNTSLSFIAKCSLSPGAATPVEPNRIFSYDYNYEVTNCYYNSAVKSADTITYLAWLKLASGSTSNAIQLDIVCKDSFIANLCNTTIEFKEDEDEYGEPIGWITITVTSSKHKLNPPGFNYSLSPWINTSTDIPCYYCKSELSYSFVDTNNISSSLSYNYKLVFGTYTTNQQSGKIQDLSSQANLIIAPYYQAISNSSDFLEDSDKVYIFSSVSQSSQIKLGGKFECYNIDGNKYDTIYSDGFWINNKGPSVTGKTFIGWSETKNGELLTTSPTVTSSHVDWTMYARYADASYTVTLDAGSGGKFGNSQTYSESVAPNSQYLLNKSPDTVPSGKTFAGWADNPNSDIIQYQPGISITITYSRTFYAVYRDNNTITYNLNPPTNIVTGSTFLVFPASIPNGTKVYDQAYSITSTIPSITGHTFKWWKASNGITYAASASYTPNIGTVLTAQWSSNTYNITELAPNPGPGKRGLTTSCVFNTTLTLPTVGNYNPEDYTPKTNFWKITNGATEVYEEAGASYPFLFSNNNTQFQSQWSQVTSWRQGQLWIYVGEEGN